MREEILATSPAGSLDALQSKYCACRPSPLLIFPLQAYVVFVSNKKQVVPLWRQKAGKDEARTSAAVAAGSSNTFDWQSYRGRGISHVKGSVPVLF